MSVQFDPSQLLWVEKYRPQTVQDCILPVRIKKVFSNFVEQQDFPSLLLSGTPGVGKTTIAKALCRDLGVDCKLINASNERGIDVLRTTIERFASSMSFNDSKFKVVIMDEFDYSTPLLQGAMRAAIEDYAKTCRFIFTCNHPNRIMDAIHSRCSVINVSLEAEEKPEIAAQFMKRIGFILKNEGVEYDRKAIAQLIQSKFPDFRKTINELEKLASVGKIDLELVTQVKEDVNIVKLVKYLRDKDFPATRQWVAQNSANDVDLLFRKIYDNIADILVPASIPEAIVIIAQYQFRGVTCPDPEINLVACLVELMASCEFKG